MENFISALGSFSKLNYNERAAFGFTSVKRDIAVRVEDGHTVSKRRYVSSEEYTALGNVEVEMSMPLDDPRGVSIGAVGESGLVTEEMFLALMRRYGAVSRPTAINMAAEVEEYIAEDSHIALLVALLSLYYSRRAHESGAVEDIGEYNDGHIKVSGKNLIVKAPTTDDWRLGEIVDNNPFDATTVQTPPQGQTISLLGFTDAEANVVLTLLSGKNKTSQFAFDLQIPELADRVNVTNKEASFSRAPKDVKASVVLSALDKYVYRHRLEAVFGSALSIMTQIVLTPVPDTAEGLAWLRRRRSVVLPKFRAWRAAYKPLLLEAPFGFDAQVAQTWKWWRTCRLATTVVGGAYNALSLWGRYFVEAGYYDETADVGRLGHHYLRDSPGAAYYAYASLITGHETVVNVPAGYGLDYKPWREEEDFKYGVEVLDLQDAGYNLELIEGETCLVVKELPPPCSAIHVIGRMPKEGMYSTLSNEYTLNFERVATGWILPNVAQAWGFGMVTRWLGYDVEMTYNGVSRRANWASNATGVAARPFSVRGPDKLGVIINHVAARRNVFSSLPSMGNDVCEWKVSVAVSDNATVTSLGHERVRIQGTVSIKPPEGKPVVYVPAGTEVAYAPIRMRVRDRATSTAADFQVVEQSTVVRPPEPSQAVVAPILETEPGADDDPGADN